MINCARRIAGPRMMNNARRIATPILRDDARRIARPMMMGGWRLAAPLAISGWLAACAAPVPPPQPAPEPVAQAPATPPRLPQTPVREEPAPAAVLRALGSERLDDRTLSALGLSGREKANGPDYRLRESVPRNLASSVPRTLDGLQLFIADPAEGGWVAFYRDPLSAGELGRNARFRAVLYGADGGRRWDLPLNPLLSRADHLEIQDIRYADGRLYFNEACQSYSREAGGACSALVRVDPVRRVVEWRTGPLTSNNVFLVRGPYIIAGYGFTAEPDALVLIDRLTGRVLDRKRLDSAHSYLEFAGDDLVVITTDRVHRFRIESP
ncbi:MAG TPA: hypothetical protein VF665_04850 [Longimicrobium sp.]|jgi:hypothetical protein|uniref:hypothetical protein n=1 Tax=Longimicrobium sp. TaxID=2029185 RepID=UPI002EDB7E0F